MRGGKDNKKNPDNLSLSEQVFNDKIESNFVPIEDTNKTLGFYNSKPTFDSMVPNHLNQENHNKTLESYRSKDKDYSFERNSIQNKSGYQKYQDFMNKSQEKQNSLPLISTKLAANYDHTNNILANCESPRSVEGKKSKFAKKMSEIDEQSDHVSSEGSEEDYSFTDEDTEENIEKNDLEEKVNLVGSGNTKNGNKKNKSKRKNKLSKTKKPKQKQSTCEWLFEPWMSKPDTYKDIPGLNEEDQVVKNVSQNCSGDINAALSTALVSLPISLSQLKSLNNHVLPEDQIPLYNLVLTIAFGYLMSLFSKSGIPVIKSFTPTQIVILMMIIQSFGITSLFQVSLFVGIFIFLIIGFRLESAIKNMPKSMVLIIKVATGMCQIVNEIPYAVGITDTRSRKGMTVSATFEFFMSGPEFNLDVELANRLLTWISTSIALTYLLVKFPRWPWHCLFGGVALVVGLMDGQNEETVADVWGHSGADKSIAAHYNKFQDNLLYFYFVRDKTAIIQDPAFLFYCFVLSIVTLIEIPVTMRMCKEKFKNNAKFKRELVSVGWVNILFGFIGQMPISLPIDRNLLGARSGGTTKFYIFQGAILIVVFSEFFWHRIDQIPYVIVSIFNTSLGLLLIDFNDLLHNFKNNRRHVALFICQILLSFMIDLPYIVVISFMAFQVNYNISTGHSTFEVKKVKEVKRVEDSENCVEFIIEGEERKAATNLETSNFTQATPNKDKPTEQLEKSKDIVKSRIKYPKNDTILYILKGRNNFSNYHLHLKNFEQYSHHSIILSFEEVFKHDDDYLSHYEKLIKNALELEYSSKLGLKFYFTGFSNDAVENDYNLRTLKWVRIIKGKKRILYTE